MDTSFKHIEKIPVERHRIQFNTREGFAEACRRCGEQGFLRFRNGKDFFLVGRLVRANQEELIIELDAARDVDT
ncbi:MAG: hypothetical protein ISN26_00315 [Betaproteobacteria bacterium AqS2]|uniref:Uncharacterized protein n=1 Tax=Candidatus Amphirhobacter heronislandensis TaxID=1732024 RepID=A0A930UAV9_9GAMM|nr:hypothetical protein [Betaproteobacteria bacterium AqS2]